MSKFLIEITAEHVRNPRSMGATTWWRVKDCMGQLLPRDIGKRCYDVGSGVVQCENDEQRDRRIAQ